MTVVVGYLPDKGGRGSLDLGIQLAYALGEPMTVITVLPRQWSTPSLARVDAEFVEFTRQVGAEAERTGREYLSDSSVDVPTEFRAVHGRSVGSTLIETVQELGASTLVLGSSADGEVGRIVIGSTADKLLHTSPVPLALAPREYRSTAVDGIPRVTCAFSDTDAAGSFVRRSAELAERFSAPLRIASFGVRGGTIYTAGVGLSAEDSVLASWTEQAGEAQRSLVTDGVIDAEVETVIGSGNGWGQSMASIDWRPNELLTIGSSSISALAQVFLGSRASKLITHSPVPVLVLPADARGD